MTKKQIFYEKLNQVSGTSKPSAPTSFSPIILSESKEKKSDPKGDKKINSSILQNNLSEMLQI